MSSSISSVRICSSSKLKSSSSFSSSQMLTLEWAEMLVLLLGVMLAVAVLTVGMEGAVLAVLERGEGRW